MRAESRGANLAPVCLVFQEDEMSQTNVENAVINDEISKPITAPAKRGLSFKRFFTKFGRHPFEEID